MDRTSNFFELELPFSLELFEIGLFQTSKTVCAVVFHRVCYGINGPLKKQKLTHPPIKIESHVLLL